MELTSARPLQLRHALRLEYFTVAWNLAEGLVAVTAALSAGSVALLGFGIDSFVEMASGLVLVWRLRADPYCDETARERLDRRALRLVGVSLFLLAGYVAADATQALVRGAHPEPTSVGIVVTALSVGSMLWLGNAKRRAAALLGSRALQADAFQTTACVWLSLVTLCGIGLNAFLGWWWADPVAALCMTPLLVREGRRAWRGETCVC